MNSEEKIKDIESKIKEHENEKKQIEQYELKQKKKLAEDNIETLRIYKDVILLFLEHDRTSCSNDKVVNGYSETLGYARCRKCHLIEILDGYYTDGEFDIKFDVAISKVQ